ncbi:MAG: MFS transporter [Anaerolineae bacterium]|nr:MFS transporter [Anaerolineae bacterium]
MSLSENAPSDVLRLPEFRYLLGSRVFSTLAQRAIYICITYQIFELTKDPLALGWLGLIEAIPALSLALYGGHVADRNDRRRIVLITQAIQVLCALLFAFISCNIASLGVYGLYAVVFIIGIARGFSDPALSAFEAQVIPANLFAKASAMMSSLWQALSIIAPALGGVAYAAFGPTAVYGIAAGLLVLALLAMQLIAPKPKPIPLEGETVWQSLAAGVQYVKNDQILLGSMALDLFAVLFGGVIALLPVFAESILQVGPVGYGFMQAAPSIGALFVMLYATRRPPLQNAGRNLLIGVAGFGVSIIVFALSTNFVVSFLALVFTGVFDGISMVIRMTIVRVFSPEHMRARIAAVSWIFIGASNEIGAFESGVAAKLLGTAPSVFFGGCVTLLVVALVSFFSPKLRQLKMSE